MPNNTFLHFLLLFVISLAISCQAQNKWKNNTAIEKPLLFSEFSKPDPNQVWKFTTLDNKVIIDRIDDFTDGKLSFQSPNVLKSPKFTIEPLKYYQLTFSAKATQKSYWAIVFFDDQGELLLADVYSSFDPAKEIQSFTYFFQSKCNASQAQLWFRPDGEQTKVEIENVFISHQEDHSVIKNWADSIYATIPPLVDILAPTNRGKFIPKTLSALHSGERVKVVMLGNSIINDTGNSAWEILLKDKWPDANVEVITSVGGGKGCWYYQENNRVDTFVVQYNPDLLIIGGISQRGDTAAIHNVINQVREKISPEILVFTGPVGKEGDPRSNPDFKIPAEPGDYRLNLKAMAKDANVGYWDMQTEWGRYIQSSGKPYDFYLRDPVHANSRGRQILARLMTGYFAPKQK